jgi:cobalamin biosynthesis protein CobW
VLNKTDLVGSDTLAGLAREIGGRVRPGAKLVQARFGALDPKALLGLGAAAEDDLASRKSHADLEGEHDHDDFESFVVPLGAIVDTDALATRIAATVARHDILRVKGFLDVPGKPMRLAVQGVGPRLDRYFDRPWREGERRSALVVIGRKGLDRANITKEIAG